jgi:hypothetical protein
MKEDPLETGVNNRVRFLAITEYSIVKGDKSLIFFIR